MRSAGTERPRGRRPDWKPRFLELIAATGNVHLAAAAVGVDRSTPYVRAARDPAFAAAWARAREDAIDTLEAEARRRALASSDPLLMFLLRSLRPERYREALDVRLDIRHEAERMAERLGCTVDEVLAAAERKAREVLGP
jgi:hypothetical protein